MLSRLLCFLVALLLRSKYGFGVELPPEFLVRQLYLKTLEELVLQGDLPALELVPCTIRCCATNGDIYPARRDGIGELVVDNGLEWRDYLCVVKV